MSTCPSPSTAYLLYQKIRSSCIHEMSQRQSYDLDYQEYNLLTDHIARDLGFHTCLIDVHLPIPVDSLPLVQRDIRLHTQNVITAKIRFRLSRTRSIDRSYRSLSGFKTCLVDVHLAISIDVCLLYKEVYFRVGKLRSQLSHNVSQLLRVDRPRTVLVKKLFTQQTYSRRACFITRLRPMYNYVPTVG